MKEAGNARQLYVDGKPFLILGGELGNSSASSEAWMEQLWPRLVALNMNTVLAPVYWELLEAEEGQFDFSLVDMLVRGARRHGLKLVFLWFGVWKNSMSCYAPLWVKTNTERFPRMKDSQGKSLEILSCFSEDVLAADIRAFRALLSHIRSIDGTEHTVIMIQVENEIGMIPCARDMSETANRLYNCPVPDPLLEALGREPSSASWEACFGADDHTAELFMAWHYARFVDRLASAGKEEYPLPMYVNAALNRDGLAPGEYPSAGPLPHLFPVWKAGAPAIDFLSPDIYFPDYKRRVVSYRRDGNPVFVPENQLGPFNGDHAFFTVGACDAIGYSPFSVESQENPAESFLARAYAVLRGLSPIILAHQGAGKTAGILLENLAERDECTLGSWKLFFRQDRDWLPPSEPVPVGQERAGCLVVALEDDTFLLAGKGILVTFACSDSAGGIAGIAEIDEMFPDGGLLTRGRRLNGDQNHQGRHVHLTSDGFSVQRVRLYRYS